MELSSQTSRRQGGIRTNISTQPAEDWRNCTASTTDLFISSDPMLPRNADISDMGVSLNGGTPISHPKMIIFSRKTNGCWVPAF